MKNEAYSSIHTIFTRIFKSSCSNTLPEVYMICDKFNTVEFEDYSIIRSINNMIKDVLNE